MRMTRPRVDNSHTALMASFAPFPSASTFSRVVVVLFLLIFFIYYESFPDPLSSLVEYGIVTWLGTPNPTVLHAQYPEIARLSLRCAFSDTMEFLDLLWDNPGCLANLEALEIGTMADPSLEEKDALLEKVAAWSREANRKLTITIADADTIKLPLLMAFLTVAAMLSFALFSVGLQDA